MPKKVKRSTKQHPNRISINDATTAEAVREIQAMAPIVGAGTVSQTAVIRAAVMNQLAALKRDRAALAAHPKMQAEATK